ncbi:tetratricopeptide repeat protein [Microcoleus sp. FACHB-1515]|uniref:tetratricopeptide repeat protein n=1 Tax=Cyanophyceae TaxID=3028117 RepID=UPI0016888A9E|nr:tetratricopeptide repeat protein [Microcoleus sp. FACHB-1515]MBD2092273.1 tetratricopeptide repeat protein [Microcoleus sp. FACHB-1515]
MPTIAIREHHATATGFAAELTFDGRVRYFITITDPFASVPEAEALLEWYFEEWVTFPFIDRTKKDQAVAQINDYGRQLFEQVFRADPDVYSEYRQLRNQLHQVQIEIEGSPEFHALHWEAIADPQWPRPLAIECVITRKHLRPQPVRASVRPSPVVNLLVVTARPDEEKDVGYRTISRPLVEAIQTAQLRVNIEILRPGTFEALARHLQQADKQNFYHIIHFDLHGILASYEHIQAGIAKRQLVYQMGYAQSPLKDYEGVKAFLFFEGDRPGEANPVEAADVANLLTGAGIPVCILNACQSGKQIRQSSRSGQSEDQRETSLGSRLMAAGMQMVVAMGYSVTVSAAKLMMAQVYRQLFDQQGMTEALRLGRRELFHNKQRQVYFNQTEDLEDWLLPVVYCNQTVDLKLRSPSLAEEEQYYEQLEAQSCFTPPEYGIVGRDLDILKLERALLQHNVLLVQGMGGTGKTTLLTYLRSWWQTTRFADRVFYFGYDTKAWTVEQILFEISSRLYGREEQARFQAMNPAAQLGKLIKTLNEQHHILMLDNLESVTGQPLAIQNTLLVAEQTKLRDFLQRLAGGKTRVVLGSRSQEEWLQDAYRSNRYELHGLDPQAQTELATKILDRQVRDPKRIAAIVQDQDFKRLLKLLAGYPLAIEVVLANLQRQSPTEILQALEAADVSLDRASDDKTQSILKCVEYSHSQLSAEAQKLLLCLAPFNGIITRNHIAQYINQLKQLEHFRSCDFNQFDITIEEAIKWGLLSPHKIASRLESVQLRSLTIQPVLPYFLKTRLRQESAEMDQALCEGFKNYYQELAANYRGLIKSKDLGQRKLGLFLCYLDYENLFNALQICLEQQQSIKIYYCLFDYLDSRGDAQNQLKLLELIWSRVKNTYSTNLLLTSIGEEVEQVLLDLGNCYINVKNYQAAKDVCEELGNLLQRNIIIPEESRQFAVAVLNFQLGLASQGLRQFDEAKVYYDQALEVFVKYGNRRNQAMVYNNLGVLAQDTRELEQAKTYYKQTSEINLKNEDYFSQAGTYNNLGVVALRLQQFEEAKGYYQQALNIYIQHDALNKQALIYSNLGVVALKLREFNEARACYRQALAIGIKYADYFSQSSIYQGLGRVAEEKGELDEAKDCYLRSLQIVIECNDDHDLLAALNNFDRLYQLAQDESLLEAVVAILRQAQFNITVEELKVLFQPNT